MSLTYAELQQALTSLPYRHATADTNVLEVINAGTNIVLVSEDPDSEKLDEANATIADLEKEIDKLETDVTEAESKGEDALQLLAEVKDDAGTLQEYRDRAEAAELIAANWKRVDAERARELTALRKRKGVESNVVAHAGEVVRWIAYVSQAKPQDFARYVKEAGELYAKLHQ